MPITVLSRSKAWTVLVRSNTGSWVLLEAWTSACAHFMTILSYMYVSAWRLTDLVFPIVYRIRKLKKLPRSNMRAVESLMMILVMFVTHLRTKYQICVFACWYGAWRDWSYVYVNTTHFSLLSEMAFTNWFLTTSGATTLPLSHACSAWSRLTEHRLPYTRCIGIYPSRGIAYVWIFEDLPFQQKSNAKVICNEEHHLLGCYACGRSQTNLN
jgi:hypothetical protein